MSGEQKRIAAALHVKSEISPEAETNWRVQFLVDYALSCPGTRGFVLGISGGQDSSLAGRLAQLAVEELRSRGAQAEFWALRLPYGAQADAADAALALEFIRPDHALHIDIKPAVDAVAEQLEIAGGEAMTDFNKGNLKARTRMSAQYALAGDKQLLVIGTDHAAEAITGFFTKFGDGAADVVPLQGLTKEQGARLLQHLGSPARLWRKTPTADLLDDDPGQSDESSLGISYAEIDAYLCGNQVSAQAQDNLQRRFAATQHKRQLPPGPYDNWWRG